MLAVTLVQLPSSCIAFVRGPRYRIRKALEVLAHEMILFTGIVEASDKDDALLATNPPKRC